MKHSTPYAPYLSSFGWLASSPSLSSWHLPSSASGPTSAHGLAGSGIVVASAQQQKSKNSNDERIMHENSKSSLMNSTSSNKMQRSEHKNGNNPRQVSCLTSRKPDPCRTCTHQKINKCASNRPAYSTHPIHCHHHHLRS